MKTRRIRLRFVLPLTRAVILTTLSLFAVCGAAALFSRGASAADDLELATLPLRHVVDLPLPGRPTRWDYASGDPQTDLLFIAHLGDSEIVVVNTRSARVITTIPHISSVHGVFVVPELGRVYASATGTNEIVVIDEETFDVVARIPGGVYPDGMAYVPCAHKLYVSDETGNTETVIDVSTNKRIATIALGGEAGNSQYDPVSRHVFVNVQTRRQLVEIDPATDTIASRIDLPGAKGNHGLLIVPESRLAFIACEGNSRLIVLDMRTMKVVEFFDLGRDPDVLAFDPTSKIVYVAGEAGVVSMFRIEGTRVSKLGDGRVGSNAHVLYVDAKSRRSYFPLKNMAGHPVLRIMAPQ
ncbi:YncE family protein [Caballeronia sp. J97]|uniref:YncE family protein n=1 Tax=Caballeronia sp. J97 TaxID=2805429 RepID=UPI002AAF1F04|nr:YncE family protein [Caballeronia sp. J97]